MCEVSERVKITLIRQFPMSSVIMRNEQSSTQNKSKNHILCSVIILYPLSIVNNVIKGSHFIILDIWPLYTPPVKKKDCFREKANTISIIPSYKGNINICGTFAGPLQ